MFGLDFKLEIDVPALERRYGYYVMPVLHEDRLVARVDPAFDRKAERLSIRAITSSRGARMQGWRARPQTRLLSSRGSSEPPRSTMTAPCRRAGGVPSAPDRCDVSNRCRCLNRGRNRPSHGVLDRTMHPGPANKSFPFFPREVPFDPDPRT